VSARDADQIPGQLSIYDALDVAPEQDEPSTTTAQQGTASCPDITKALLDART
jgi:hypothetical protein